jgi:hypothetical protein
MAVKVGKGKGGKKKGGKKKGGKKKGGKKKGKKGGSSKGAFKRAADELAADERLQFNIMKEDHGTLLGRARGAEDKNTLLQTKLKHLQEDEQDIFENLRSKVEKSRAYAKVLLDQRDVLEREKKDAVEALEGQLDKQTGLLRHSRGQLKILKERWHEQQDRMKSAAHTLAARAETEGKMRQLEHDLHDARTQVHLRESQNEIISSIKENAQHQAVAAMLLECLKQFPDMVVVQRESVSSLTKILNLRNFQLVLDAHGVSLALKAVRAHRHDEHLVTACLRLLWRLFVDGGKDVVEPLLLQHGCLDEVLTSLQTHPVCRRMHYNSVGLLKCLLPKGSCDYVPKGRRRSQKERHQKNTDHDHHKHHHHHHHHLERSVISPNSRASSSGGGVSVPQTTGESSLPSLTNNPSRSSRQSSRQHSGGGMGGGRRSRARSPPSVQKSASTPGLLPHIGTPGSRVSRSGNGGGGGGGGSIAWGGSGEDDAGERERERREREERQTTISPKTIKKWRTRMSKKTDVGPIATALLQCMRQWPTKIEVVEKCVAVLATLFFEETETMARNLMDYSTMRSVERGEAQRGFALVVIDEVLPGGERAFVQLLVDNLKVFEGSAPHEVVLQGMICLMFKKMLPDDPELKTMYLRAFKELDVPKTVYATMSLPHAMADPDLKKVGLWILEYFAMPPPGKRRRKKHKKQEVKPPVESFM